MYPHYVTKVEKKGRTSEELDEVIRWLTGFDEPAFDATLQRLSGTLLHVHWRPATQTYPLGGDDVRMLLTERFGAADYSRETESYVLDRWDRCGC